MRSTWWSCVFADHDAKASTPTHDVVTLSNGVTTDQLTLQGLPARTTLWTA